MSALYDLFRAHPHISTDSRAILPDSLFFALHGATFDGNRFAADALRQGSAYAIVDDATLPEAHPELSGRLFVVDDTLRALQDLAREHRRALGLPILAITGTNGKTTTKELTSRVLAEKYALRATQGNLNNHIGVPLTLLSFDAATEFGVVEMGASAQGEIALLCSIAEPDYGLITNIGRAHLEGFGGENGVRRGKGELYDWLAAHGGRAFVVADDPVLMQMAAERPLLQNEHYSLTLADDVDHALEGEYNRFNVAAAVAVGCHFGIEAETIRRAIASYRPYNNRSQRITTGHNTLIADCYNANPSSMEAAIENFHREVEGFNGAKVLILGDMLELGAWSDEEHRRVIRLAAAIPEARLILVGPHFATAHASLPEPPAAECYPSRTELTAALAEQPIHGARILIKGSHGIGLEKILEIL